MKNTTSLRLRQLRTELKKSQAEMAIELYVEQSTYSRYETGQTQIPVSLIKLISEKYKISPVEFIIENASDVTTNAADDEKSYYTIPKELLNKIIDLLDEFKQNFKGKMLL